jgi:hypothetical protein
VAGFHGGYQYHAAGPLWLAPIAPVEYLKAALPFAVNNGFGMAIAQLNLTNPAGLPHRACGELSNPLIVYQHRAEKGPVGRAFSPLVPRWCQLR